MRATDLGTQSAGVQCAGLAIQTTSRCTRPEGQGSMAKTLADKVEDEIRKRVANAAAAAGVDNGRIELETMWLLPSEFVRMYQELYHMALGPAVSSGTDGGKDEGRVKAPGKPRDELRVRSMAGAKPGKRYVNQVFPIRDEEALEAKRKLD